ncbi:MAG: 4a-hydroxytetrahydrobiopterin dehydratase [Acidobacteriota bacterium]|nr:4a-hydroxytetrahydrobiopterin dehydratase [Blastocatellia bacterium]MDW8413725.1 4a-hydroxytetrahydrobiopterin dehydratase [Acidobacteriota bacterium]
MTKVYTEAEVVQILTERLPNWSYTNGYIERTFQTVNWRLTVMLAAAIAFLAEAAWHHPELDLRFKSLTVRLHTHDYNNAITSRDIELAVKIEELATWKPLESDAVASRPGTWLS